MGEQMSTTAIFSRHWSAARPYFQEGPSHLLMYTLGRFGLVRSAVLSKHRLLSRKRRIVTTPSQLESVDVMQAAAALDKNGCFPSLRLQPDTLVALQRFASNSTCFGGENYQLPFTLSERAKAEQRYRRKLSVGRFDDVYFSCPTVRALTADETLIAIARAYFRCEPVLLGCRMWWSFPSHASKEQQINLGQGYHYDLDGYRALAFFFYLTDVGPDCGPHVYVPGSHVRKPLKSLLSLRKSRTDAEIENWYGAQRPVTACGAAGSGFAEDIFCFHKGSHPIGGERLILQIRFGIEKYGRDKL